MKYKKGEQKNKGFSVEVFEEMEKKGGAGILEEVKQVLKERARSHGDFKKNFESIATFWNEYLDLGDKIKPKDVVVMMELLKIARIKDGEPRKDDWKDIIGYATLGSRLI